MAKKRKKEKAKEPEELSERDIILTLALESAKAGTWIWDVKEGRVFWDKPMKEICGLQTEDLADSFESWKERIHPDDMVAADRIKLDGLSADTTYEFTYRILGHDNKWRHINARGMLIRDKKGNPVKMAGIAVDVTPR